MKTLFLLLFLGSALWVSAQQPPLEIRPTTAGYRYEVFTVQNLTITNWFIDFFYGNLPQGRTYQRQVSETGIWRNAGEPFYIPVVPDAMASYSEGMNLLPDPPPIHFFRLVQVPDVPPPAPEKTRAQINSLMEGQPTVKTMTFSAGKKKFKNPVLVTVGNGRLIYTPAK